MVTWALVRAVVAALTVLSLTAPARGILCVQCEADSTVDDPGLPCFKAPPVPQPCPDGMRLCMTLKTFFPAKKDDNNLVSVVRTCAPVDVGWDCKSVRRDDGRVEEMCHDTCDWDGCNAAPTLAPAALMALLLVALALKL